MLIAYRCFGKQLMGAIEGDSVPTKAVPEMIEWWRDGKFPFDKLVKFFPADKVEEAIAEMSMGGTIKPVLTR